MHLYLLVPSKRERGKGVGIQFPYKERGGHSIPSSREGEVVGS